MGPDTPLVSVVMANYNGGEYLHEAIESVLSQTYKNFEFIIVDDGSTEDDCDYIRSIRDPRIKLIVNEKNRGQTASLNIGIAEAKGIYIARMDSDDVNLPTRLEKQVSILERNPELSIIGSQAYIIDGNGNLTGQTNLPTSSNAIWAYGFFQSPFIHPSVMIRSSIFNEHKFSYDTSFINQDFDLWSRLLPNFKGANVDQILLKYRLLPSSMTHRHYDENIKNSANIILRRLKQESIRTSISFNKLEMILRYLFADRKIADADGVDRAELGHDLWMLVQDVRSSKSNLGSFTNTMVYRIFQSSLWLGGQNNFPGRIKLISKLMKDAPINILKLFLFTIPVELVKRKCKKTWK